MPSADRSQHLLDLAQSQLILRAAELGPEGIPRVYLRRLYDQGLLRRLARGCYTLPGPPRSESHALAMAAAAVPKGVICLHSALRFHHLLGAVPEAVWMALPASHPLPQLEQPPLRCLRLSGPAYSRGHERHVLHGIEVTITNPAKTIADAFAFREQVGVELAIAALRQAVARRQADIAEIWSHAGHDRVEDAIRPWLEAVA